MRKETAKRVLAIDPYSRGVGFAVLEGPGCLIDWGLRSTGGADNAKAARAIDKLIDRFRPDVLALEDWDSAGSRRCGRVQELLGRIAAAEGNRVLVRLITWREIRAVGPLPQTGTKHGRACFLAERFPELQAFQPPFRRLWMPEDDRMAIFDAVGFAVASYPARRPAADPPKRALA
jgi:hypothetical protein